MKRLILLFLLLQFVLCCEVNEEEIYSTKDGLDHKAILNGSDGIEKLALQILYEKKLILKEEECIELAMGLSLNDSIWRNYIFDALTKKCLECKFSEDAEISAHIFNYYLHYPSEYMFKVAKIELIKSDLLLVIISRQVQEHLSQGDVTISSMKNLAYKYCQNCTDQQLQQVYVYLDLAASYIIE